MIERDKVHIRTHTHTHIDTHTHTHLQLGHDAPNSPHVNGRVVGAPAHQDLRGAVPARGHILGHGDCTVVVLLRDIHPTDIKGRYVSMLYRRYVVSMSVC